MTTSGVAIASLVFALLTIGMAITLSVVVFKRKEETGEDKPPRPSPEPPTPSPTPPTPVPPPPTPTPPQPDSSTQEVFIIDQKSLTIPFGPGNDIKQTQYQILPLGSFKPTRKTTAFVPTPPTETRKGSENYVEMAIQPGSGKDEAHLQVVVFEGAISVDPTKFYTALPPNTKTQTYNATRLGERGHVAVVNLDGLITNKPGTLQTVAVVITYSPGKATDDAIFIASHYLRITSTD